jgi:SAM-dependent methyltransferase
MGIEIEAAVKEKYGSVATSGLSSDHEGVKAVAEAFGYSPEELTAIPAGANMGLSCGNPTATAHLRPGEVVVDLGSGGGLDVFLSARQVGPSGKAVGIDMTPEMIALARKNAESARDADGTPLSNVEFHLAAIDRMPLADASADCVISNCVINLASDKQAVFREIARVLKPGGRLAVSDIALKKPLPPEIGQDLLAYVGCVAGAIPIGDYVAGLREAGFSHVEVVDSGADLNAYAKIEGQAGCCGSEVGSNPEAVAPLACCTPAPAGSSACCTPSKPVAEGEPCCSTEKKAAASAAGASCCSPAPTETPELLTRLAELTRRYDINEYAASVKVYAIKPEESAS